MSMFIEDCEHKGCCPDYGHCEDCGVIDKSKKTNVFNLDDTESVVLIEKEKSEFRQPKNSPALLTVVSNKYSTVAFEDVVKMANLFLIICFSLVSKSENNEVRIPLISSVGDPKELDTDIDEKTNEFVIKLG